MKIHLYAAFACVSGLINPAMAEEAAIAAEVLVRSVASWDGTALPAYPAGNAEISIVRYRIPAGVQLPMHKHPVINAGVLLSGQLTVITEENEVLHLQAGDPIVEVVDKWHYGRNDGEQAAEIIVFYAGMPNLPLSVHRQQVQP